MRLAPVVEDSAEAPFAQWVRPHLVAMTRLAVRLGPSGEHDDVVQEALVRAWRRRETYDSSRGSAQAWLLAIVADRARRARSRAKPEVPSASTAGPGPAVDDQADPALELAVRRLSHRQRMVVELHYYLGLPVRECAAVLGVAEGTVKSTLFDARSRLRVLLEVEDD